MCIVLVYVYLCTICVVVAGLLTTAYKRPASAPHTTPAAVLKRRSYFSTRDSGGLAAAGWGLGSSSSSQSATPLSSLTLTKRRRELSMAGQCCSIRVDYSQTNMIILCFFFPYREPVSWKDDDTHFWPHLLT